MRIQSTELTESREWPGDPERISESKDSSSRLCCFHHKCLTALGELVHRRHELGLRKGRLSMVRSKPPTSAAHHGSYHSVDGSQLLAQSRALGKEVASPNRRILPSLAIDHFERVPGANMNERADEKLAKVV